MKIAKGAVFAPFAITFWDALLIENTLTVGASYVSIASRRGALPDVKKKLLR